MKKPAPAKKPTSKKSSAKKPPAKKLSAKKLLAKRKPPARKKAAPVAAARIPAPVAEPRILTLTVPPELDRQRLDKAIAVLAAAAQPGLSRMRVRALMDAGCLTRNSQPVQDASAKARQGEVFALTVPPPEAAEPAAQAMPLDIVYEDEDVIVIDKPAGLVVHPAPGNRDRTLVNALLAHCGAGLSGIGGVARPGIVHRLDKDTSGLIVAAKNDAAHQHLSQQFADRSLMMKPAIHARKEHSKNILPSDRGLSRTYQAVVWGVPVPHAGEIDAPIGRSSKDRKKMAVMTRGKPALTFYRVLADFGFASLVECKLATGRTHQIRVHMAYIKCGLVGDMAYRGPRRGKPIEALLKFPRQALHAVALQFVHPRTGKVKKFKSELPADMQNLLNFCRTHF